MRAIRLYIDAPLEAGQELALPDDIIRHATRVLRLGPGDPVVLFNGDGAQYPARLTTVDARTAHAQIDAVETPNRESPLRVTLVQALARGEKMDWIIQKAAELGVTRILPVVTERSEVKLDAARGDKRLEHWRAVAIAACEQCGRNVLPELAVPAPLATCLAAQAADPGTRWMLHPGEATRLRDVASGTTTVALAIGPEGGFGDTDLAALRQAGYHALVLGPRILRTETAGLAAVAALQAVVGDF